MEISFKSITLFSTVLLTGLSAGFFYAWAVSVIPGTRQVSGQVYLETMQSINRAILNPAFYLIFFGSLLMLAVSAILQYRSGAGAAFWLFFAAGLTYLIGAFGITAFGNVPLNDALEVIPLDGLSPDQLAKTRRQYETRWNRLHMIRTVFAVVSFLLSLTAVFRIN
ncbi:MAG: DUF1772 domain-containing protein [Phaeodactylibacter sp.]|nr:DUF1772 domain-containing protein [Phaeodactylibacter sp.]MCB9286459.1 DUF1772 domain-containing protein [Lewinellaceae bacterium]